MGYTSDVELASVELQSGSTMDQVRGHPLLPQLRMLKKKKRTLPCSSFITRTKFCGSYERPLNM